MKIQYWVTFSNGFAAKHFSVTGEGSIEEECYENAIGKVNNTFTPTKNFTLTKVAIISK